MNDNYIMAFDWDISDILKKIFPSRYGSFGKSASYGEENYYVFIKEDSIENEKVIEINDYSIDEDIYENEINEDELMFIINKITFKYFNPIVGKIEEINMTIDEYSEISVTDIDRDSIKDLTSNGYIFKFNCNKLSKKIAF